ncbi:MAG: DNA-processing protein DprA [Lachnospiraceae bacterium]|nr:DNA-processing protein DprA [Lachnospiraceae bacterium]
MIEDIKYDYWWAGMKRSVPGHTKKIAENAGSTRYLYEADREDLIAIDGISEKYADEIIEQRSRWDIDREYDDFAGRGIRFIPFYSDEYPARLKGISGHPFALFVLGDLPGDDIPSVAIIGARNCSQYGRLNASRFGADLAGYGVQTVSGMAYGIDGISQEEALNAGGRSFAVLGCGVNKCYPPSNRNLYERLKKEGGIISEYGLYNEPLANMFPARNRIISALSDVVLVIEARERSGTMITVDMALEQGRDVAIIPGRISDPLSTGCINLWKQGAYPVTCAEDIMYLLDENFENKKKTVIRPRIKLPPDEKVVYRDLEPYAKSIGQITDEVGLELRKVITALVELSIKGLARETGKGCYVKVKDFLT